MTAALFAETVAGGSDLSAPHPRRSAALLLHAMSATDRNWALSELAPQERSALTPLLRELQEMAVPADAGLIRQVLSNQAAIDQQPAARVTARDLIAAASAQVVTAVLLREPTGLIRQVEALGPWPWSEALVTALRVQRGEALEPSASPIPAPKLPSSALEMALLTRLAAAIQDQTRATPAPPAARTWWDRVTTMGRHRPARHAA